MPRVSNQRLAIRQSPHHVVTYILIVSCLVPGCVRDSCTNSSFKCCRVDKIYWLVYIMQHVATVKYSLWFLAPTECASLFEETRHALARILPGHLATSGVPT